MSDYSDTLAWLYGLEVERMDLKLERTTLALRLSNDPQRQFPSVHIAGTNGKGSTAAILHAILSAAGYKAGLFTSPHLIDFCERIRIGPRCVSPGEVVDTVAAIKPDLEPAGIRLTPFEMMTVLAFRIFAQARVDIAIVEVGLGGRLDATNVLTPLVSIITSIGLDHQQYLGSTLADIAREKGGIIKPMVPVVLGKLDQESRDVLYRKAQEQDSAMLSYGQDFTLEKDASGRYCYRGKRSQYQDLQLSLNGKFQVHNAAVALASLEYLQDSFPVTEAQIQTGLRSVRWPGRLDIVSTQPLVILDGAHNIQALHALLAELPDLAPNRRPVFLFGVMRDKEWRPMVAALEQVAAEVVVTAVAQPRAEEPYTVQQAFSANCPVRAIGGAVEACRQLLHQVGPQEVLVVCGSLFLVGEVLPLFPEAGFALRSSCPSARWPERM